MLELANVRRFSVHAWYLLGYTDDRDEALRFAVRHRNVHFVVDAEQGDIIFTRRDPQAFDHAPLGSGASA